MIELDAATVLLQWAVGGLFFLWVTGRGRLVGIGYGWTMRLSFMASRRCRSSSASSSTRLGPRDRDDWRSRSHRVRHGGLDPSAQSRGVGPARSGREAFGTGSGDDRDRQGDRAVRQVAPRVPPAPRSHSAHHRSHRTLGGRPSTQEIRSLLSIARVGVGTPLPRCGHRCDAAGPLVSGSAGLPREPIHELVRWTGCSGFPSWS